jgi:hypothetical protein
VPPSERRRTPRMGLSVTVRVQGHDPDGTAWEEMSATDDASYGGASFPLKHAHAVGQVFSLSLPLPRNFRRYDLTETSYKIFALVRNTRAGAGADARRMAGVMFVGRVPPKGYEAKPGGRYRLPDDPLAGTAAPHGERRHRERLQIFVNLRLRRLGTSGTMEEQTVTENGRGAGLHHAAGVGGRSAERGRSRRPGGHRGGRAPRLRRSRPRDAAQPALPRPRRVRSPAPGGGRAVVAGGSALTGQKHFC